jgi:hypothetical protein
MVMNCQLYMRFFSYSDYKCRSCMFGELIQAVLFAEVSPCF